MGQDIDRAAGPIIVFDGVCVLCSANARFVLRHDSRRIFRLAAMQSSAGQRLYRENDIDPDDPETLIIVDGERVLRDSDAIFFIWQNLGFPWAAATVFRFLPPALRDAVYRWIARNRYRLFGKRETCWLPAPEDADRLL